MRSPRHIAGRGLGRRGGGAAAPSRSRGSPARFPGALTITADARKIVDVERAFAEARMRFADVDLVVVAISPTPAAGAPRGRGRSRSPSWPSFAPYLDDLLPALVNVAAGRLAAAQAAGARDLRPDHGRLGPSRPGRTAGPWATAAFATRGLMQAAASELREHGVHVALPDRRRDDREREDARRLAASPPEQSASEEDVARAVAYLASQSPRALDARAADHAAGRSLGPVGAPAHRPLQ